VCMPDEVAVRTRDLHVVVIDPADDARREDLVE